jgi:hypothetical protein
VSPHARHHLLLSTNLVGELATTRPSVAESTPTVSVVCVFFRSAFDRHLARERLRLEAMASKQSEQSTAIAVVGPWVGRLAGGLIAQPRHD